VIPLLIALLWIDSSRAGEAKSSMAIQLSQAEVLRQGERMYREGILPSGEPMKAVVKGDIPVAGTAFTCASCHLRSGLGSVEGGVITPPTNGPNLYQPITSLHKLYKVHSAPLVRPAYTDKSLADVLMTGIAPGGRKLNDVMPRYMLDDRDMAILISYLKSLSSEFSPGVTETTIHLATVVTDDVSPEEREAMLTSIEKYFTYKNNLAQYYQTKGGRRSARMAEAMLLSPEVIYKRLLLSRWLLSGPPETWRSQLEEYYRKDQVFALLSGITKGQWQPIHQFCEDNRIPSILPITDYPVISDTDWFTIYFSKGLYQEGEGAARHLNSVAEALRHKTVVEVVRDSPEGRALSKGFQETWQTLGHRSAVTVILKKEELLTTEFLERIVKREKPAALLVWDGPGALRAIEALGGSGDRPGMVFVSSSYLGETIWTLREDARDLIYLTYPYRLPQDEESYKNMVESFMGIRNFQGDKLIILKRVYSAVQVFSQALVGMNGNYYRDYLLDLFGMTMGANGMGLWEQDAVYPLYERFSFGPGQRYASKGCYIVQLTKGSKSELVKRSDWAIH
jgi:hypothetical protein